MTRGVHIVPTRTPTLPPATHTNTWVVGEGRLTVIDPASPWTEEQRLLFEALEDRLMMGERVERIVLTHHHHDHVSGVEALRRSLGGAVPVFAQSSTARLLDGKVRVDHIIGHEDRLDCGGRTLRCLHTPGHAPGHLVFLDEADGWMIAGDMVAGIGTILLHPDEGDLGAYLSSLELMKTLTPTSLLPSHGEILTDPASLLSMYIAHRHMRSDQARTALARRGAATPTELVADVYGALEPPADRYAALQLLTHLRWMADHGLVQATDDQRWEAR
jgi:ribonuclease/clavin/mitogillin